MAMAPNLMVEKVKDVSVVTFLEGALLDALAIQNIGAALYDLVDQQDRRRIVLDFSKVRSLSSSMLGVLLTLRDKLDEADGRMVVVGLSKPLKHLFEMTALDRLFQFAPDTDAGLTLFGISAAG